MFSTHKQPNPKSNSRYLKPLASTTLALACLATPLAFTSNVFAEGSSSIFDENAASCIIEQYNSHTGSSASELAEVDFSQITVLECPNRDITNFRGTYLMPNLESLNLAGNSNLSSLDFTYNAKLKSLELSGTKIHSLDISHNPDITYLILPESMHHSESLRTIAYAEKNDNPDFSDYDYKMDLSVLKFWDDFNWDESTSNRQAYDPATKTVFGNKYENGVLNMYVEYMGAPIQDGEGQSQDWVWIQQEEGQTCSGSTTYRDDTTYCLFNPDYYGPFHRVYVGDELDTDQELEEIYDFPNNDNNDETTVTFSDIADQYELVLIDLPSTAVVTLSESTDLYKHGIYNTRNAYARVNFYFNLKSATEPATPEDDASEETDSESSSVKTPETGARQSAKNSATIVRNILLPTIFVALAIALFTVKRIKTKR